MKVVRGLRNLPGRSDARSVALGNFDGIHLGHQKVITSAVESARSVGGESVVYTFDPHPLRILAPRESFMLLTTFKKKMELIASLGVDMTILADFTRKFARLHPKNFVQMIKESVGARRIVVGHDYSFGQNGSGRIETLKSLAATFDFEVDVIEPVALDGRRVSSTLIRSALNRGDVDLARSSLGRYYSIEGRVVRGLSRGGAIGFPTANLETPYELIPAVGVYAVYARARDTGFTPGVVNVGYNPTFDRNDLIVELHFIGVDDDFYGKTLELRFVKRLRDEVKFASAEELKDQIASDIDQAREILSTRSDRPEIEPGE